MDIKNMRDIVNYAAAAYGDDTAIKYKVGKEIEEKSYRQLKEDSESFSRGLEGLELLGKHIGIIGPTSYAWVVGYFGTVNSGSVIVPLDAQLPGEDICELLNRSDAEALVFDEKRSDVARLARVKCPCLRFLISMQEWEQENEYLSFQRLIRENRGSFYAELDDHALCAILFTSGTTGKSKGVMLSHRNLSDNATCLDMKISRGTVSMTLLPIHHAYCFTMDILKALYIGMVICMNDSLMRVQKNMKLFKPEIVLLVPMVIETIYGKLRDTTGLLSKRMIARAAFGGRLRTICSGGAFLNPELVDVFKEYGITILQGYGMTECSPVISTNLEWDCRNCSVGKLLPNCEAKTVDGEIWVRGSSVMMGYYNMPEETRETLEDGWLKTGDLGYVDSDGFLYLTGRKKNLIILKNGENISPEELENEIGKNPLVKEILVKEADNVIQAEIYPNCDYAKRKRIKNIAEELQGVIDTYNESQPVYKRVHSLSVRETEFEKTASQKIKRNI